MSSHWLHWKANSSLCALPVSNWGVHLPLVSTCFLYAVVFPYIFLLFDCFEWALIDCIEKRRVHAVLWQFQMGWGVHLPLVSTCFLYALVFPYIFLLFDCFEWYLPLVSTCLLYSLVFPDIFILFDCFAWVLIDCIEKDRVHSVLWQFWMGGSISLWYLHVFSMHWYLLISSYYLTVSNGHSLVTLGSTELTQCSGSFIWGKGGL